MRTADSDEINKDQDSFKSRQNKPLRKTRAVEHVKTHTPMVTASANLSVNRAKLAHLIDSTLVENQMARATRNRDQLAATYERNRKESKPTRQPSERPKGQTEIRRENASEERINHRQKRLARKYDKSMYRDRQKRVRFSGLI